MTSEVSAAGLEILLHSLGLRDPMIEESYRNYFVAGPGHDDLLRLLDLCWKGLMKEHPGPGPGFLNKDDRFFRATPLGIAVALKHRPKITRAQCRYLRFLSVAEAWPDLTFREFLIQPEFAQYR